MVFLPSFRKRSVLTLLLIGLAISLYAQSGPETVENKSQEIAEKTADTPDKAIKAVPSARGSAKPERLGPARATSAARPGGARPAARPVRPATRPAIPGRGR
jgi:hypothetical protein